MVDVYRRKSPHLILREIDLDTIVDAGHRSDRNRDLLLTREVSFVEEAVCHVMVARIDDQSPDTPDAAIGCMNMLAATDLDFTYGNLVVLLMPMPPMPSPKKGNDSSGRNRRLIQGLGALEESRRVRDRGCAPPSS
jgi:hypothetical protein